MSHHAAIDARALLPGSEALARVHGILAAGGVIAYPTETFYALGADANSAAAVERIFALKGRSPKNPISLIIAGNEDLERVASEVPESAHVLAARFWPGPLTMVLRASAAMPAEVTGSTGKVGVRVSSHPVASGIARACGFPLTATSANLSGEPPALAPPDLAGDLAAGVAVVIDGGSAPGGPPSTVIDLTEDPPRILREGRIAETAIRSALAGQ
jgi:L-threonylcarbamoyladenylate synthase